MFNRDDGVANPLLLLETTPDLVGDDDFLASKCDWILKNAVDETDIVVGNVDGVDDGVVHDDGTDDV
jgi:hypothetical protein